MGIVAQRMQAVLAAMVLGVVVLALAVGLSAAGLSAAGQDGPRVCSLPLAGMDERPGCL